MIYIIIASGPSLTKEQCLLIGEMRRQGLCKVITVNTSFYATMPDIIYACDRRWWNYYFNELPKEADKWTQCKDSALKYGLNWIKIDTQSKGLNKKKLHINGGKNSGYQAIGLAYQYGAKKIILVGYDMKNPGKHWHGDHPNKWGNALGVDDWVRHFNDLAKDLESEGVEVINSTIDTAITCFKQMPLGEAFEYFGNNSQRAELNSATV